VGLLLIFALYQLGIICGSTRYMPTAMMVSKEVRTRHFNQSRKWRTKSTYQMEDIQCNPPFGKNYITFPITQYEIKRANFLLELNETDEFEKTLNM